MLVKVQLSHANCLRTFNSTNTSPPNVGVSITPPPLRNYDGQAKHKHRKQLLEFPDGGRVPKQSAFVRGPRLKSDENDKFGGVYGSQNGVSRGKNVVLDQEGVNQDCFFRNCDDRVQDNGTFEANLRSTGGAHGGAGESCPRNSLDKSRENGVLRREKAKQSGCATRYGVKSKNRSESSGEIRSSGAVQDMHPKRSTKWRKYGGCIPAMLEAVENINDLEEALRPWEATLTNKERSILLKEQLRWERAMAIFEWFKGKGCYEVNIIHYNIMFRILGRVQRWCELERLCGEIEKKGIMPINSTYGTLIDVYSKGGIREKAMKWLELMNERCIEPDEVTMGIVVQMYKKAGNFKMAEEFFKKWSCSRSVVKECGNVKSTSKEGTSVDSSNNVYLSTHTYNTLIDTYGKGGKLQEASETFERMLENGTLPTTVTFNTLIHMYGNNGQLDKVASLLKRMEEARCSPDTRTYNILISLHAKHNDIELAARYFAEMKESSLEPDLISYRTLLYAFSIRHMIPKAEELILEMDEKGLEIDEFTQSSLTRMYIEAGKLDRAWSWFQRFHLQGNMTSECYSANIDAFGERGYLLEAENIFKSCLEVKKFTVVEFNVMIKAYGISKKFEQACCLFDSMKKHSLIPDKCSYNSLVQMLASADLPQKAGFYLKRMQEAGLVDDCIPYCAVISSYMRMGDAEKAVGLYKEMIDYGIKPDVIVYGVLINAFADTGNVDEARHYVNAMRSHGLPMNGIICKSLIKLYTKLGYLREAQEAYKALHSYDASIDVYSSNCMIDLYSERSMISEAELIFENLKGNGNANEFTYARMLCMYKRNGMFVKAFCIARKMRELGLMTDVLSYNNVLGLYATDGRYKEAVTTFHEMLKSLIQPDESTFKSLGFILLKCGVPKNAVDRLDQMRIKDTENGVRAWASTLSSVVEMGGI